MMESVGFVNGRTSRLNVTGACLILAGWVIAAYCNARGRFALKYMGVVAGTLLITAGIATVVEIWF